LGKLIIPPVNSFLGVGKLISKVSKLIGQITVVSLSSINCALSEIPPISEVVELVVEAGNSITLALDNIVDFRNLGLSINNSLGTAGLEVDRIVQNLSLGSVIILSISKFKSEPLNIVFSIALSFSSIRNCSLIVIQCCLSLPDNVVEDNNSLI
jgi:hypothetical protein